MPVQLVFVPGARSQEVKMLCLLASGEHEALQGDMPKSWNIKPYIHKTNNSEANRQLSSEPSSQNRPPRRPPGSSNVLLANILETPRLWLLTCQDPEVDLHQ